MKIAKFARHNAIEDIDLEQAGFTGKQIEQLEQLRHSYGLLGELVSRREIQWLEFIKWCYLTGRIHD